MAFERATTHNFSSSSSDEGNESLGPDSSDQSMEMNNIPPEIELPFHDLDAITAQLGAFFDDDFDDETAQFHSSDSDEDDATSSQESESSLEEPSNSGQSTDGSTGPDTWIRDQFQRYVDRIKDNHLPFTEDEKTAIGLMYVLRQKGAPLDAYKDLLIWHLKRAGLAHEHETGKSNKHFISKKKLLKRLTHRYNMANKFPFQRTIKLPVSGSTVKITLHNAKAVIQRLLTEPRNNPEDYCFFGGNPMAPPPKDLDYLSDLNTGKAFTETHAKLCIEPGDQVLAVPLYVDGAAFSQFHSMEILSVKIALGILNKKARNKEYNWASLGYVEKIPVSKGKSRELEKAANHLEEQDALSSDDDSALAQEMAGVGVDNVQDWHAMVSCILEGLVDLIKTGMMWNQAYDGQVYKNVLYKLFVPFIKCDNKEADTMCGRFQNRSTTNQICRACHILTQNANQHHAEIRWKTKSEIQKLVQKGDLAKLKGLSQNYLLNAFHALRFSMGNDRSIHGACPTDMLHSILLGLMRYIREVFFDFLGNDSALAKLIDALAKVYCRLFGRQSDRSLPNTNFSKGIRGGGKMMAKEYRGVLLVMLAIFRCTKGREMMEKSKYFKDDTSKDDWILLLEIMLEWDAYLNSESMLTRHVKRLATKHRYILYLIRKIARRTSGMGLKLVKFHIILHLAEDILQFGAPLEFDTGANEGHHKDAKKAARLTQKEASSFQFQTAVRMTESHLLDLAMEEINNNNKVWEYFFAFVEDEPMNSGQVGEEASSTEQSGTEDEDQMAVKTGGAAIRVWSDEESGEPMFDLLSRSIFNAKTKWNIPLIQFLVDLQDKIDHPSEYLEICTWHKRGDQIFRGHPNYRGKGGWKDWVWINWGAREGKLPGHIWCFVVLRNMPTGADAISHGGIGRLNDGVYAVIESSNLDRTEGEIQRSDLLMPIKKEVVMDANGYVTNRTFYLADTEAFVGPCCAVPDIGGPINRYFVVKPREEWAKEFILWLEDPHNLDQMDAFSSDEEESEENSSEELSSEQDEDEDEDEVMEVPLNQEQQSSESDEVNSE